MRRANAGFRGGWIGVALAAAAITVGGTPAANAQCPVGARTFASIGPGISSVRILPGESRGGVTASVGTEIGRFWQSSDSTKGNNFIPGDPDFRMKPDGCPTQANGQAGGGWWQLAETTKRGINGAIATGGCIPNTCPEGNLTVVVEDYGTSGPPGINEHAHFIAFQVDETPQDFRYWDLARVAPPDTDLLFIAFPVPSITSSFKQGTDRVVTMDLTNVTFHSHGATAAGPLPATEIIASYDLMLHTGDTDPGRLRSADNCAAPNPGGRCWTLIDQIPFLGGSPHGVSAVVPCGSVTKDSFIAVGISFKGGVGPNVPSALVGRAVQIECDPNLADPVLPKPRPSIRLDERPTVRTPARSRPGR